MIKIMTGIVGLALLAAPIFGFAKEAKPGGLPVAQQTPGNMAFPPPLDPKQHPAKNIKQLNSSWCQANNNGTLTGVVVGIGGDWVDDQHIPFTVTDGNGNNYTESTSWAPKATQASLMFNILTTSYFTGDTVHVKCNGSYASAVWIGDGGS